MRTKVIWFLVGASVVTVVYTLFVLCNVASVSKQRHVTPRYAPERLLKQYMDYRNKLGPADEEWTRFTVAWAESDLIYPLRSCEDETTTANELEQLLASQMDCLNSVACVRCWVADARPFLEEVKRAKPAVGPLRVQLTSLVHPDPAAHIAIRTGRLLSLLLADAAFQTDNEARVVCLESFDKLLEFLVKGHSRGEIARVSAHETLKWEFLLSSLYYCPGRFDSIIRQSHQILTASDIAATLYESNRRVALATVQDALAAFPNWDGTDEDLRSLDQAFTELAFLVGRGCDATILERVREFPGTALARETFINDGYILWQACIRKWLYTSDLIAIAKHITNYGPSDLPEESLSLLKLEQVTRDPITYVTKYGPYTFQLWPPTELLEWRQFSW